MHYSQEFTIVALNYNVSLLCRSYGKKFHKSLSLCILIVLWLFCCFNNFLLGLS